MRLKIGHCLGGAGLLAYSSAIPPPKTLFMDNWKLLIVLPEPLRNSFSGCGSAYAPSAIPR